MLRRQFTLSTSETDTRDTDNCDTDNFDTLFVTLTLLLGAKILVLRTFKKRKSIQMWLYLDFFFEKLSYMTKQRKNAWWRTSIQCPSSEKGYCMPFWGSGSDKPYWYFILRAHNCIRIPALGRIQLTPQKKVSVCYYDPHNRIRIHILSIICLIISGCVCSGFQSQFAGSLKAILKQNQIVWHSLE